MKILFTSWYSTPLVSLFFNIDNTKHNNLKKKILTKIKPKIFKGKLLSGDMYVQIIK